MVPALVMKTAAVILGITALGGVVMAGIRLAGKPRPPSAFAMVHGLLAAAGLTLLIYAAFTVGIPAMARVSIAVLLVAALIGVWINLRFHSNMLEIPIPPMIFHALTAIAGFALLIIALVLSLSG